MNLSLLFRHTVTLITDPSTLNSWLSCAQTLYSGVGGFELLRGLQRPVMNQQTKFQQNPIIHGELIL